MYWLLNNHLVIKSGEVISLEHSNVNTLPVFTDELASSYQNKGWNLPQVWDLNFLKIVYCTLSKLSIKSKEELYEQLNDEGKPNRLIDEYWNALICFGIIEYQKPQFIILKGDFFDPTTDELTELDVAQLSEIFFSYFRFKEISNWFLKNTIINELEVDHVTRKELTYSSFPIYGTSFHKLSDKETKRSRKLTDTIFYELNPQDLFQLKIDQDKIMRFFDVFINWGLKLKILEVLNLTDGISVKCRFPIDGKIKLYYFINDEVKIDVRQFIEDNYIGQTRTISLPELTINLAIKYRCSLDKIHRELLDQTSNSNGFYSLQRTSKIFISKDRGSSTFIRDREKLYPKLGNAFVSHLILR
jgi:hypothetical protein